MPFATMSAESLPDPCFRASPPALAPPVQEAGTGSPRTRVGRPDPSLLAGSPKAFSILWIDDEVEPTDALLRLLALEGVRSDVASSGIMGIGMARANVYDAILLDLRLPDLFGLTVLERLVALERRPPIVMLSGHYSEPELHADARRRGAAAFLQKPIECGDLIATLRSILRVEPKVSLDRVEHFGIVAASRPMRAVLEWIRRVAPTSASVLLTGETGTGKELVARAIHECSDRRTSRFVPINCAAIPEALVESELFGHRKGAFTGATADKQGLFETAEGGTLFLDEIGEFPLPIQARLLRCLDSGEVRPIGETVARRLDVRVIAATNRDLRDEASKGHFRRDLYYRLCAAHFHLPPLRDRPDDIEALVENWMPGICVWAGSSVVGISPAAVSVLQGYPWPGNVRELRHVLERAAFAASGLLSVSDIRQALGDVTATSPPGHGGASTPPTPVTLEDRRLLAALEAHRWNRSRAARSLGMNRSTLWRALRRLGLG